MSAKELFFLTILAILTQAFFAMMEMSLVSFNKVRLQYYLGQENKKAKLISFLLMHPGILFGTTLIGINASLQFGSECSRRFYMAIGLNPDFAPLTQVLLVVIFAELAPLIAARRYAEHVALLGVRILYIFSVLLRPFVLFIDLIIKLVFKLFKFSKPGASALTKEEIEKAIETREDKQGFLKEEEFDQVMANLFSLKNKTAFDLMLPIDHYISVSYQMKVGELKKLLTDKTISFVIIHEEKKEQIVGFVSVKEILFAAQDVPMRQFIRSPWFVPKDLNLYQLIEQFKKSGKHIAFVLDQVGKTVGVMTLSRILETVFEVQGIHLTASSEQSDNVHMNRSFAGNTQISIINQTYHIHIPNEKAEQTLDELMQEILGHHPSLGESIRIGEFELIVEEAPLIGEKVILVKSL
jgi:CBS domain containing-hemolysin-like protein